MKNGELRVLARVVPIFVLIEALIRPALLIWSQSDPYSYERAIVAAEQPMRFGALGIYLATLIVFGRWIYVTGRNLVQLGVTGLQFTPASRIWWFFVAFANLIKPVEGIRELWNASHGNAEYAQNNLIVTCWWILWIFNAIAVYLVGRFAQNEHSIIFYAVECALGLMLAGVAITLVLRISHAQMRLPHSPALAEIFA